MAAVRVERRNAVAIVTIDRPDVRNAVDGPTAQGLADAFRDFAADDSAAVAVLTGAGDTFCAGADLKALASGEKANRLQAEGDAPMGPTRLLLEKPVIAAVEGHAVAGGFELALWCDLRVAADNAIFGVFNRRWGVPLIDGGTIRLPRIVGHGRALDLILTGRHVSAGEALGMGLVNRVCPVGEALATAVSLADQISRFPQMCLRSDRRSVLDQWSLEWDDAIANEFRAGSEVIASGEAQAGAARFASGRGRHGEFEQQ